MHTQYICAINITDNSHLIPTLLLSSPNTSNPYMPTSLLFLHVSPLLPMLHTACFHHHLLPSSPLHHFSYSCALLLPVLAVCKSRDEGWSMARRLLWMLKVIAWLVANFTIPYTQLYIMCTSMYVHHNYTGFWFFYIQFSPCCSDNIGIFDAAWDRGGMGSVALKDRQRYSTKHMHNYSTYILIIYNTLQVWCVWTVIACHRVSHI